jgi:hypothetical protein
MPVKNWSENAQAAWASYANLSEESVGIGTNASFLADERWSESQIKLFAKPYNQCNRVII